MYLWTSAGAPNFYKTCVNCICMRPKRKWALIEWHFLLSFAQSCYSLSWLFLVGACSMPVGVVPLLLVLLAFVIAVQLFSSIFIRYCIYFYSHREYSITIESGYMHLNCRIFAIVFLFRNMVLSVLCVCSESIVVSMRFVCESNNLNNIL